MTDDTTIVAVAQAIHAASPHAGMPLGHCDCAKAAAVAVEAARRRIAVEVEAAGQVADDRYTFDTIGVPCGPGEQAATRIAWKAAAVIVRGQS